MILAVAASAAMLSACHTSGKVDNLTINVDAVSSATTAADVPYKVANGYFVRNDVKKLPNGKISKQKCNKVKAEESDQSPVNGTNDHQCQ